MVYCSVPGCEKFNKSQNKRFVFSFPKKKELVQKWLEAIPSLARPVKSSWRVCQYHFKPEDILKSFSHTIGGEVFLIERERPRLKPNVVPTRNLEFNKFIENNDRETKSINNHKSHVLKQSKDTDALNKKSIAQLNLAGNQDAVPEENREKACVRSVEIIKVHHESKVLTAVADILHRTPEFLDEDAEQFESQSFEDISNECNQNLDRADGIIILQDKENSESSLTDNKTENLVNCSNPITEVDYFDNLFDSVFEVVLPTTLWGVHRSPHQKRIMFVCVDEEQLNIQKMLIVDDSGDLKMYLVSRLIREEHWPVDILTPERISDMLAELEAMQICLGANLSETCEVLLTDVNSDEQITQRLCKKCC
ncbi:uncharacterized protein LOC126760505 [Bactrocera neohumeralis]|uniref:uncharacterized protein LOC120774462 n=1 Tax=Bactrocera tryoni TaxID=59916 RepID=UPI001A99A2F9|nr:uncharacterized protein LOC120774462 [Bactrocera tryoni]XP_050332131.1 uncharacterized protein LOC126760505 [Bactrocera neohumeralis]